MNRPCPRDSAPVRARAGAAGAVAAAVPSWPRPGRTAARQARARRRDEEKGGRRPAPALVPRARGYPPRFTCAGRAGNGVGTQPAAATRTTSSRGPTSAPWSWSSRSAPSANTTGVRTISGHASRLTGSQPAIRTSDPAATAQPRPTSVLATARLPGVPGGVPRGAIRTSTSPPQAAGRSRQEQGGELPAPPCLGCGNPQPGAPGRGLPPGQGEHVRVFIRHVTVRDRPPLGIAGIARSCRHDCSPPVGLAVGLVPPRWLPAVRAVPCARSGGPGGTAGDDRRAAPARPSSLNRAPGAACALPDLTSRPESSVDAPGPGRKASRTGRPARETAFVARCGRSAPSAAARDPRRPRPAAGGRGGERRPW